MTQDGDQMFLISQPNASFYTHSVSQEEESRCRRRRKKEKVEESKDNIGFRKRKLTDEQVKLLEESFGNEHKLESERKDRIAAESGLDPRQVAVWFQNRRVRWRTKKIEEEYSKLKMEHEGVIVQKTCLESEVLKLKKQLTEAEKEIQKLSEEKVSNGSPNSSFSLENYNQDFVGEFEVMNNGFENLLYNQENYYYVQEMGWDYLYGGL